MNEEKYKSLIEEINKRKQKLEKISQNLKQKFVGIDKIIDSIIENINVWYLMPELIRRPIIINLWGLTGVGKTDLIRTLVKELEFSDKFLEIQLNNKGSDMFYTSVQQYLSSSSIGVDSPGILLLDEIQRFRTKDQNGMEIYDSKFQDIWALLSDGKFTNSGNAKEDLLHLLCNNLYYDQYKDKDADSEEEPNPDKKEKSLKKEYKYRQNVYSAAQIKKRLKVEDSIEEIMMWDDAKKMTKIYEALQDNTTFEADSYNKLLIFISGNLDEAYNMAEETGDADRDADVFYDFSSKINIVDIKNALNFRFKPEQIARFGNIHLIYPSLNKDSYNKIIQKKIDEIVEDVYQQHNIKIIIDKTINECIYRNGVFPAQGVRPVFSSVSSLLGNSVPSFILEAIENKQNEIYLNYEDDKIIATIGDKQCLYHVECSLDKIKKDNSIDEQALNSVHEAGHAISYAILFNVSPTQINTSLSSSSTSGFIGIHNIADSKVDACNKIMLMLAGRCAEEIVFGEDFITSGAQGDIRKATDLASSFFRDWGMGMKISRAVNPYAYQGSNGQFDLSSSNIEIENLLQLCKDKMKKIIEDNIDFLIATADKLIAEGSISPIDFKKLSSKFDVQIEVMSPKNNILFDCNEKLQQFKAKYNISAQWE